MFVSPKKQYFVFMACIAGISLYILPTTGQDQLAEKNLPRFEEVPIGAVLPFSGPNNETTQRWLASRGWVFCDGKAVSSVNPHYKELFDLLHDSHGAGYNPNTGEKVDNKDFNIPDYRGRFLRGLDTTGTSTTNGIRDPDRDTRVPMIKGGHAGAKVGSVQNFATSGKGLKTDDKGQHDHEFNAEHDHDHNLKANYADKPGDKRTFDRILSFKPGAGETVASVDDGHTREEPSLTDSRPMAEAGGHAHSFKEQDDHYHFVNGGNETRPINAYVNWIIKVRQVRPK